MNTCFALKHVHYCVLKLLQYDCIKLDLQKSSLIILSSRMSQGYGSNLFAVFRRPEDYDVFGKYVKSAQVENGKPVFLGQLGTKSLEVFLCIGVGI